MSDQEQNFDSVNDIMHRWSQSFGYADARQRASQELGEQLKRWATNLFPSPTQSEHLTTCDCGGFKTYQSLDPIFHSHWCSSLNNKSM